MLLSWVTAIASVSVAISGPAAFLAWLRTRRLEQERQQSRQYHQAADTILHTVKEDFVPRSWALGIGAAALAAGLMAFAAWADRMAWAAWASRTNPPPKRRRRL